MATPLALISRSIRKDGMPASLAFCTAATVASAPALSRMMALLPRPIAVRVGDVAAVRGAPLARRFDRGDSAATRGRILRHATIEFGEPVGGPLVIGAGRHLGFGLLVRAADRS